MDPEYTSLARELVRALRGRRSQGLLSKRLGYRSNALYTWEAGTAFPSAARCFALCERVGVDLASGLTRFYRELPPSLRGVSLTEADGVRRLLIELRGRARLVELARSTGLSRFTLSRWLSGATQPNLPEFLCFVDHASLRLLDFLSIVIDPGLLPSRSEAWRALQQARRMGYERPLTQAVLRALETEAYAARPTTKTVTALTGIKPSEVQASLRLLAASGQIRLRAGRYEPSKVQAVDFRRDPEAAQRLKAFWAALAAERSQAQRPGLFAYNVFAVSRADLERLQSLQRAYLNEMRTIIARSEPSEVVALANVQLFALGDETRRLSDGC
jgi:transcriptional regulator with XRE-family HTH domain